MKTVMKIAIALVILFLVGEYIPSVSPMKMSVVQASWYDCVPYEWKPGNTCGPDNECDNPEFANLVGYGYACQPKLWYDYQGVTYTIDWLGTCDSQQPYICNGIFGWRSCRTTTGLMMSKGYLSNYALSDPIALWHPYISWNENCIAPWRIRWRYDPETISDPP